MRHKAFMGVALSACLIVAVYAAPGAPAKTDTATVGDFVLRVASALGYEAATPKAAADALRARGGSLAGDLSATLTEGEAARIVADLGMSVVQPTNPLVVVSASQAIAIAGSLEWLGAESFSSQTDFPTQCLAFVKGECKRCCKKATGCGDPPAPFTCGTCARFCRGLIPPPSPSEPGS